MFIYENLPISVIIEKKISQIKKAGTGVILELGRVHSPEPSKQKLVSHSRIYKAKQKVTSSSPPARDRSQILYANVERRERERERGRWQLRRRLQVMKRRRRRRRRRSVWVG